MSEADDRPLVATYRLQLRPEFGFREATAILPYLAKLGVSHVYLSPCFEAVSGSTHGYDVVDFGRIRDELGGIDGYRAFTHEAQRHGLGQVLDIVPHHMSTAGDQNRWWWDVLRLGQASRYANHFDIDWRPPEEKLRDMVLLPVLGDHYGRVLEGGDLRVEWTPTGRFQVRYHDVVTPLSPAGIGEIVVAAAARAGSDELAFVGRALIAIDAEPGPDREARDADLRTADREIARLAARDPAIDAAIELEVTERNRDPDALDRLLGAQHYRLARWQVGSQELDYRRFFDITTLVALRSERTEVFGDTHDLVLDLVAAGAVDGLRIDHVDGLADPQGYLDRLRAATGERVWIVVEKILHGDETLPRSWPVHGTTGYDFLRRAGALFVDPAGAGALEAAYRRFTGDEDSFDAIRTVTRRAVLQDALAADLDRLTALLVRVCERHREYRDFTRAELRDAVLEVAAHTPAYRSYVRPSDDVPATEHDIAFVETAIASARRDRPDLDAELLALLADLLCGRWDGAVEAAFVQRFQQLTGPVAAKGDEDTAFYRSVALLARNEVGWGPDQDALEPAAFHAETARAGEHWPDSMLTTSTHDTKRSEDVRARLVLLSEIPDEWERAVTEWAARNERHRTGGMPDRKTEWLLYQTLVGAHPLPADRAWLCIEKSIREAKEHTSWTRPDGEFETATRRFVEGVLADPGFTNAVERFVAPLVEPGRVTALAQTVLKLTAPGIPDIYQGSDLWDLSLVDPDNRRPVDYAARSRLLESLPPGSGADVWRGAQDTGLPKLLVISSCLALRRRRADAFGAASPYEPLVPTGEDADADRVVAFMRGGSVISIVPRLVLGLRGRPLAATIPLPRGRWVNIFTGHEVEATGRGQMVAPLLESFPVAVLERVS